MTKKRSTKTESIGEARLLACHRMPYLTTVILSLHPVESEQVPTLAIDKWMRLYYNRAWMEQQDLAQATFCVLAASLHVVFRLAARCKHHLGPRPEPWQLALWSVAADLVVNQTMAEIHLTPPEGLARPEMFGFEPHLPAEDYYDLLVEQFGEQAQAFQDALEQAMQEIAKLLESDVQQHGSACDGQQKPWEEGAPQESDVPGIDEFEQQRLARHVAEEIDQFNRKRRGTVPLSLRRMARRVLRPKVNPAEELRSRVKYAVDRTSGYGMLTYQRPNRRSPPGSAILPAHRRPVPRVVVIVDTSGSMGERDLNLALGVIADVLRTLPSRDGVRVLAGDTCVQAAGKHFRPEDVELIGGGGTNMGVLIRTAAGESPRPNAIFVVTDSDTPWPEQEVGVHTLACLTRPRNYCSPPPEWIQTVYLHDDEED